MSDGQMIQELQNRGSGTTVQENVEVSLWTFGYDPYCDHRKWYEVLGLSWPSLLTVTQLVI